MDYQIWIKVDYGDQWNRKDAGDITAAKRVVLEALKAGSEPILTIEVPFDLQMKIGEPGSEIKLIKRIDSKKVEDKPKEEAPGEAHKDTAKQDQDPRS